MNRALACLLMLLLACHSALSQNSGTVAIPGFDDKYSKIVRQLEAGQTTIDYREFRESFLDSEQFKAAGKQSADLDTLRKTMHELMKKSAYAEVVDAAKKNAEH